MDLLYEAAKAWSELSAYRYRIIYKKGNEQGEISLGFENTEFYHLAGFQYLNDIVLPFRSSRPKTLNTVLAGKITEKQIAKSEKFKMIEERLLAITKLQAVLDTSFKVYRFNPNALPFYTKIVAQNLISANVGDVVFLFTDSDKNGATYSKSIFLKHDDRDYTKRQKELKIIEVKRETAQPR